MAKEKNIIDRVGDGILGRLKKSTKASAVDWETILQFILENVLPLLMNCKKQVGPNEFKSRLRGPGRREKIQLKVRLREALNTDDSDPNRSFMRGHINEVVDACVEEASKATEAEVQALSDEVDYDFFADKKTKDASKT